MQELSNSSFAIKLSSELPPDPIFVDKFRRAPTRGYYLSAMETKIALKNAYRYQKTALGH